MKKTKRILALLMALVLLVSAVSVSAHAASITMAKLNLGYMAPTNNKGTKLLSSVTLYGKNDYINFYINCKKDNSYFFYEIYSDKNYTEAIDGGAIQCNKGEFSASAFVKLVGVYKTKTYYMITYAAKVYSDGSVKVDKNSMKEFKVVVKRTASFDDTVVILNNVKNTYNGPKVSWKALDNANKYIIYRRSITGTKWTKVGTVAGTKRVFTDKSVKDKNGNYIYTVKAVNKKGVNSRYLYTGLVCLFAKAPVISSVSVLSDNTIQVKWKKTKTGAKYTIMRKEGSGSWKAIKSNYTGTTFKDTTAKNGKTYKYTIKATITTDYGKTTSGYYTTNGKTIKYLEAPALKEAVAVENGINVSWGAVSGSDSYTILRRDIDESTPWAKIGEAGADQTNFIDTSALGETSYIYTVRADAKNNNGSYSSFGVRYNYVAPETTLPDVSESEVTNPDSTEATTEATTEPETTNSVA